MSSGLILWLRSESLKNSSQNNVIFFYKTPKDVNSNVDAYLEKGKFESNNKNCIVWKINK